MSAATASRNYGGTATQTMTTPHHHQLYPTPHSSTSTVVSSRQAGVPANVQVPRGTYGYPSSSASTRAPVAGSWSMIKEGDKQIIVIEDTPEPEAGSSTATATTTTTTAPTPASRPSTANASVRGAKKPRTNGYNPADAHQLNNLHYPPPNPSIPSSSSAYAASNYAAVPAKTSASSAKRKYNEVNDHSTANDRLYTAPKTLQVDDKDGHYIIRPDDELGDTRRYKIIRLLGQGTFGKVVEAWDRDMRMKVAVKIIRAIQKYRDASKVEIKVLNLLRERDPANNNKCIHLLDCFDHKNHICIVTRLLSCSVFDFLKDNNYLSFPMAHIQSFARQLLLSVAFLHDLRLVHTDLKPENILLVNNDYGSIPITAPKNNPGLKTKKILKDPSVHLIDFGSATFEEEYHASVVSTRHYRAPEIILGLGWSYPCDVWSIGCILVEFFTGEALFQTHENLEHLAMMEVVFGKMPNNRFGKNGVKQKPEWFDAMSGKVKYPLPTTSKQSKKYVKAMKPLETIIPNDGIVNSRFLDLLRRLLKWDPAERCTVKEALRHPFFSLDIHDEEVNQLR